MAAAAAAVCVFMASNIDAAVIQLRKSATVSATVITLGDVADIRDSSPEFAAQLQRVVLAPTPPFGRTLQLDFATIRSRMQSQGIDLVQTEFSGSAYVNVIAGDDANSPLSGRVLNIPSWKRERVTGLITEAVAQHVGRVAPDLGSVSILAEIPDEQISELLLGSATGYQVLGGAPPWDVPQTFELRFHDTHDAMHAVRIRCRIQPQPRILVARYPLPRGHLVVADDLAWRHADNASTAFTRPEEVVGSETLRTVRQDEPLTRDNVRAVPLVRNNEIVTLVAGSAGVTARRQMKARTEGALGDVIPLVSLDGKQQVIGRVIGTHLAEAVNAGGPSPAGPGVAANWAGANGIGVQPAASGRQGVVQTGGVIAPATQNNRVQFADHAAETAPSSSSNFGVWTAGPQRPIDDAREPQRFASGVGNFRQVGTETFGGRPESQAKRLEARDARGTYYEMQRDVPRTSNAAQDSYRSTPYPFTQ